MKLSLFAGDSLIVYMENPIDSTKKPLNLSNEFGKTGEIREKIPFDIATRKIKHLGINPTKQVKYLYSENYITLKK